VLLTTTPHGVELTVRVIPRASASKIAGVRNHALLVRLSAPPVEGAANEALAELLSATFAVPRRAVTLLSGQRGRLKRVAIAGRTLAEVREVLAPWLAS